MSIKEVGIAISRGLGWGILLYCTQQLWGWYAFGFVVGAVLASPTFWWVKDNDND